MSIGRGKGRPWWLVCFPRPGPTPRPRPTSPALEYLAEVGFPSERPFGEGALTSHEGQAVLVTEFVKEVAKAKRPPHPIVTLGARIGRLHRLAVPAGADRPSGALHHFAEGTMADELRAVAAWLDATEDRGPGGAEPSTPSAPPCLAADGGDGLPEAFVHPDPVPKNAIFTADGPILVDWTSAGRGPRLASMALVLRSGWAAGSFSEGLYPKWSRSPRMSATGSRVALQPRPDRSGISRLSGSDDRRRRGQEAAQPCAARREAKAGELRKV